MVRISLCLTPGTLSIMQSAVTRPLFKGTDHAGTFMSLKSVVYYANYRSWHQSSKIQVVP